MKDKILEEAKKYISNPDYVFDMYDTVFIYANEKSENKLGLPKGYFEGKTVFKVFGYTSEEELQKSIRLGLDDTQVNFELKIAESPIHSILVKFKNFKFENTPYRVGKILEYIPKK